MANPAANLAIVLLVVFIFIALACWYLKTKITVFARSLLERRRRQQEADTAYERESA